MSSRTDRPATATIAHEDEHHRGGTVDASLHLGRHLPGLSRPTAVRIPWDSPTVRVVLASTLLAPLGIALITPGLPVIQARFGLTEAQTSLIISAYFVTGIVLSPVIGLLEDRIGRRPVLVPSLLLFSLSGVAIVFVPSYSMVVALRVVQGTAAAGIFITTVTVIGDTFEGAERSSILGVNTAVLSAGAAAFPIVGGVLATWGWNWPFALYLLGLPVGLYVYRALEEPPVDHDRRGLASIAQVFHALSAREAALLYGSAFMIELLLFGAVITALPFLLASTFGVSPVGIGLVVTGSLAASAVSAAQAGRLTRWFSDDTIIVLGFASAGVGLVAAWQASTPLALGFAGIVFGVGWGVTLPSIDDEVSEYVPASLRAEALSLRNSATFLGRAIAPVIFTTLAVSLGYQTLMLAAGVVGFLAGLVGLVLARWPRTGSSTDTGHPI